MDWDNYYEKRDLGPVMWFCEEDIIKISQTYHISYPFAKFLWRRTEHSVRTFELMEIAEGMSILEVGCGTGSFSAGLILANQGKTFRMVALDYSSEGIRSSQERFKELALNQCSLIVSDILTLPFHNDTFDIVIAPSVIEHVPSQQEALLEMARVCRGKVIISTDNSFGKLGTLGLNTFMALGGKILRKLKILPASKVHFISNTPQGFRRKTEKADLNIEVFEFTHFSVPFFSTILNLNKSLPHFCQNWLHKALLYLEIKSRESRFGYLHPMFIAIATKKSKI